MAVVLEFARSGLLACRFAVSPLLETGDALRSLAAPGREGCHLPWQRAVRPQLPELRIGMLLTLLALPGYQPDFLSPPPEGPFTEAEAELRRVRETPPDRVAAELAQALGATPAGRAAREAFPALAADPASARDELASQLERAWVRLVAPWWPRLRDILDADIAHRARQLASHGVAATLIGLDPKIIWRRDELVLKVAGRDRRRASGPLTLVPSAFVWPRVAVLYDPPALVYPARGVGRLWERSQPPPRALSALIGATRAAVVTALAEPATTSGLAARCGLPLSTVSEHLSVLRAAGLVSSRRAGRAMVHEWTALGVALAGPSAATGSR